MNDRKDYLHNKAVEYYRAGTTQRWRACLAAYRIIGRYTKGEASSLAYDLRISVSAVENLARAGLTYVQLRPICFDLPRIRNLLTYSHFATLGDAIRRYDIPVSEAIEQLRTAADEGASVEQLRNALAGEYNPDGHVPWKDKLTRIKNTLLNITFESDIPERIYKAITDFINELGEWKDD